MAARLAVRFHRLGHRVHLGCCPADIMAVIRTSRIDLVIADVHLSEDPVLSWVDQVLDSRDPPALALIAESPSIDLVIRAANLPLAGFLAKPLTDAQLEDLVEHALARRRD